MRISNTEKDIIDAVSLACEDLGIPYSIRLADSRKGYRPLWAVEVHSKAGFQILHDLVPLASSRKQALLEELLNSYRRAMVSPPKEVLEECYLGQKMSITEVAAKFSAAKRTMYRWLQRYGIPLRPRGRGNVLKRAA